MPVTPPTQECTGNAKADADAGKGEWCTSQEEQDLISAWIMAGMPSGF